MADQRDRRPAEPDEPPRFIAFRCREHRQDHQRLWQVARTTAGGIAGRPLEGSHRTGGERPGAWAREQRQLEPGLYCQLCLQGGSSKPLGDYDSRDLDDAGLADEPHLGLLAEEFDLDAVWQALEREFGDLVVATSDRAARAQITDPGIADDPRLHPEARRFLKERVPGPGRDLWSHQGRAIAAALDGRDVVVETATASGKSLCYWVPALSDALHDPGATTLYLAPLNALVEDQLEALSRLSEGSAEAVAGTESAYCRALPFGAHQVTVARYDGQVLPTTLRRAIRNRRPTLLITNPEMLNRGILPHHHLWRALFAGLATIVLDEMHVYGGMFGANVANLVRRVLRLADAHGRRPRIIGCSASIGNPAELFRALTGRTDALVVGADENGARVHRQRIALLDAGRWDGATTTLARNLILRLVGDERARTIAFMRSISEVDQVYGYVSAELRRRMPVGERTIREYKREIPVAQKAEITRDLRSGVTHGVITTTALQLGIDIGDLSAAVVSKYPGSKAAFLQQVGRAGRSGESVGILILDESPLDQHFAIRPDDLLERGAEVVYLNPDHPEVLARHLLAAAEERPLDLDRDRRFFGDRMGDVIAALTAAGALEEDAPDVLVVSDRSSGAAQRIDIRALGFTCVIRDESGDEVSSPDVTRAMQHFHARARFRVQDSVYEVVRLAIDWDERAAHGVARRLAKLDFTTTPRVETECEILALEERAPGAGPALRCRGRVRFRISVPAYYRVPTGRGFPEREELGDAAPPPREITTEGMWIEAPAGWLDMLQPEDRLPAVRSAAEALRTSAALLCSTDLADVGLFTEDSDALAFRIVLSDTEAGGNGLTRQIFAQSGDLLGDALAVLEDCPHCSKDPSSRGCPRCVTMPWGDEWDVNRQGGIVILRRLAGEVG